MQSMATWEMVLVGVLVVLVLLWVRPGIKNVFEQSRQAENKDWAGVLIPIGFVVLFVLLLIMMV